MVRVQIQLPDELHVRAKNLAAAKEVSVAELARRGLELVLAQTPAPDQLDTRWELPIVEGLGWRDFSHAEIKDAAQTTAAEEELEALARTPAGG